VSLTLENSVIFANGHHGVYASISKGIFSGMTINGNGRSGMTIFARERQYEEFEKFEIRNTTVAGNVKTGFHLFSFIPLLIQNSTFSSNGVHGVALYSGDSSLFAKNGKNNCSRNAAAEYFPTLVSDDRSCRGIPAMRSARHFGELEDNGCESGVDEIFCPNTHKLLSGSAARGAGDCTGVPGSIPIVPALMTDQRGFPRASVCSAGAFEPQKPLLPVEPVVDIPGRPTIFP